MITIKLDIPALNITPDDNIVIVVDTDSDEEAEKVARAKADKAFALAMNDWKTDTFAAAMQGAVDFNRPPSNEELMKELAKRFKILISDETLLDRDVINFEILDNKPVSDETVLDRGIISSEKPAD